MESKNREVRGAYQALYATYQQFQHTYAKTLQTNVKVQNYRAKVRNYKSARHAALAANFVQRVFMTIGQQQFASICHSCIAILTFVQKNPGNFRPQDVRCLYTTFFC